MTWSAAQQRADAEPLEQPGRPDDDAGHGERPRAELGPDVVDDPQPVARLGAHGEAEELREPHSDDPGIRSTHVRARSSPSPRPSSDALERSSTPEPTSRTWLHGTRTDAASRGPRREAAQATSRAPGGRADDDRGDARGVRVEPLELEVVDLPAATVVPVDELVVEDAAREVELRHPRPMFESTSSGIAATAITSTTTR